MATAAKRRKYSKYDTIPFNVYDGSAARQLQQEEVLQPPAFREAVWQAFSAGVLPLEGNKTERTVTICLTGDAAQPFLFMECN